MAQEDLIESPEGTMDDIAPLDSQESEEDLVGKISFKDAVSMTTDWTIETLNGQVAKKNIDLTPEFQRRTAWDDTRKSRLMESIIVGLPVPNIVLAEDSKRRGSFIVIDGKQRLASINEFYTDKLVLKGLDIRGDLNGFKYSDLSDDDRLALDNSTLRSTLIKNWGDEKFLYIMFFRLNSGSLPLSPQELRKALIGGRLLERIESYLKTSEPFHKIFGKVPDKRMRDSELVLRFIAFDRSYQDYKGNLKDFLDTTTNYFEDEANAEELEGILNRLNAALQATHQIFGDKAFKKWLGDGKHERRINRAIFDCITRFFAEPKVANQCIEKADEIVEAFHTLCLDTRFKEAIEKTTKSLTATAYRVDAWGIVLANILKLKYEKETARLG